MDNLILKMLVKRISDIEHEQIIYSVIIRSTNKSSLLLVGRKRNVHLYNIELDKLNKLEDSNPEFIDSIDFKEDIIEMRSFEHDLIVVLDNLQIYYIYVAEDEMSKEYAGVIKPLADSPVVRIKYTSLVISSFNDFGLLSIFNNSFVILYISQTIKPEARSLDDTIQLSRADSTTSKVQSSYIYYDFQVNSSLLLLKDSNGQENIWHLDDNHNLVKSVVERNKFGDISLISDEDESIIFNDDSLIDINYYNKDLIVLLSRNSFQFYDVKNDFKTNSISTGYNSIVTISSLLDGALGLSTKFLGVSSIGELYEYEVSYEGGTCSLLNNSLISDVNTTVTSISTSNVNKN